jgi:hypothetical protein
MANVELLLADAADLFLGSLLGPSWGIYQNGQAVIQPANQFTGLLTSAVGTLAEIASIVGVPNLVPVVASTVSFEFAQDWPISDYPQEQGAFQSYNKVTLPFDVKVRLTCQGDEAARQAFLTTCLGIAGANAPAVFDVQTPEIVFTSCSATHINWRREADQGVTLIVVELWFKQIAVTTATTFENTQQPGDASPQSLGNGQAQTPSQYVSSEFAAGSDGGWVVQ